MNVEEDGRMYLHPNQMVVQEKIKQAIQQISENDLHFQSMIRIEGVIGLTIDKSSVFVIQIDELINKKCADHQEGQKKSNGRASCKGRRSKSHYKVQWSNDQIETSECVWDQHRAPVDPLLDAAAAEGFGKIDSVCGSNQNFPPEIPEADKNLSYQYGLSAPVVVLEDIKPFLMSGHMTAAGFDKTDSDIGSQKNKVAAVVRGEEWENCLPPVAKKTRKAEPSGCSPAPVERPKRRRTLSKRLLQLTDDSDLLGMSKVMQSLFVCRINDCGRVYQGYSSLCAHRRKSHNITSGRRGKLLSKSERSSTMFEEIPGNSESLVYVCRINNCGARYSSYSSICFHRRSKHSIVVTDSKKDLGNWFQVRPLTSILAEKGGAAMALKTPYRRKPQAKKKLPSGSAANSKKTNERRQGSEGPEGRPPSEADGVFEESAAVDATSGAAMHVQPDGESGRRPNGNGSTSLGRDGPVGDVAGTSQHQSRCGDTYFAQTDIVNRLKKKLDNVYQSLAALGDERRSDSGGDSTDSRDVAVDGRRGAETPDPALETSTEVFGDVSADNEDVDWQDGTIDSSFDILSC